MNVGDLASDVGIESNVATGVVSDVITESRDSSLELRENDGLSLNLTDLSGDDFFHVFSNDGQLLLNDFNRHGMADEFFLLLDDGHRGCFEPTKVLSSVEVVEIVQRVEATPTVERNVTSAAEA